PSGVAAVGGDDAAAGMGSCAAEPEPGDGSGGGEAPVPHLVGEALALEDVAAGEADAGLDVGGAEHLAVDDAVGHVGGEAGDLGDDGVGDPVPPGFPVALGQGVGNVLGEDAHGVAAGGCDAPVIGGLEVQLAPLRLRLAPAGGVAGRLRGV